MNYNGNTKYFMEKSSHRYYYLARRSIRTLYYKFFCKKVKKKMGQISSNQNDSSEDPSNQIVLSVEANRPVK